MGQGRQRNRKTLLAIAALSSALGACEGEQVLVGTARESLHLDLCMGASTVCEPALRTETLRMPEPRSCEAVLGPELEPDFSLELALPRCAGNSLGCSSYLASLTVAPDGTSWVGGSTSRILPGGRDSTEQWLARVSPQGELLGEVDPAHGMTAPPENAVLRSTAIAIDERSHVFVVLYEMDAGPNADSPLVERAWLTEYDTDGAVVTGPSLLTGLGQPRLALAGDDTLVIAANGQKNAPYGLLAALDAQGELLWSQTGVRTDGQGVGYGVVGVATSAADVFVLAQRSRGGPTNDDVTYGLMRFGADGNAIWDRVLESPVMNARLFGAGDDHLLISVATLDGTGWLGRADKDGAVDWAYEVGSGSDGLAVDVARGVALVLGGGHGLATQPELIELSLDGERCTRHALPGTLNVADQLAIDRAGGVYVMDGYTLTRVSLPEE